MAQIPKGRSVKGPYKSICRHLLAIYFSGTVYHSSSGFPEVLLSGQAEQSSSIRIFSCTSIGSDTAWGASLSLVALLRGDLGENG